MSVAIYTPQFSGFFVACMASTCQRCGHRGRCVQVGFSCTSAFKLSHTHMLCLGCFASLAKCIDEAKALPAVP